MDTFEELTEDARIMERLLKEHRKLVDEYLRKWKAVLKEVAEEALIKKGD